MSKYENGILNFYNSKNEIIYNIKDKTDLSIKLKGKELDRYLEICSYAFGNTMVDVNDSKNTQIYKETEKKLIQRGIIN